jgi:acylphosphatase
VADQRVRVVVNGRVQGVFFRATCAERARALGLGGFVRNRPDGCVEAVFEGAATGVQAMVAWCHRGTDWSRVDSVDVSPEEPAGEHEFRVGGLT